MPLKATMHLRNAIDMQLQSFNLGGTEFGVLLAAWERDADALRKIIEAGATINLNDEMYTAALADGRTVSGTTRTEIIRKLLEMV